MFFHQPHRERRLLTASNVTILDECLATVDASDLLFCNNCKFLVTVWATEFSFTNMFLFFPVTKVGIACHSVGSWMFLHHHMFSQMQQSVKFLSHSKQLNGSSPVWLHFKWSESTNLLKHFEQLNCPFFNSISSFMFTLKRTDSKKVLYIGERGNGCCCSFKNVTQPLMFKCQTWLKKCQNHWILHTKLLHFTLKFTTFSRKIA